MSASKASPEQLKIARALEDLIARAVDNVEYGMNVLKLPASLRAPMWEALTRRAMVKCMECEKGQVAAMVIRPKQGNDA